ncbi:hypothetical protein [Ruminococcus sp.]|uniref:hypothetical protein n=1 Tax=Ruminococcus sp. TaxID=41978 RepID=UPI003F0D8DF9
MMQLQLLVAEVNNIGRQIAKKMGVPFDESNVGIAPTCQRLAISYNWQGKIGYVEIEISDTEVTYFDIDELEIYWKGI